MRTNHLPLLLKLMLAGVSVLPAAATAQPQAPGSAPDVMLIQLGGNDCPPCVGWRLFELPKLRQSPQFSRVKFAYVDKSVMAPVPPAVFLPDEVKPYKAVLDAGGGGMSGSPQQVILVNGQVWDYHWGARTAEELLPMLQAAHDGTPSPVPRCEQRRARQHCAKWAQ